MTNIVPKIEIQNIHFLSSDQEQILSINRFIETWNNDDPHFEVHSSGSTGIPKVLLLSKNFACNSARASNQYFGLEEAIPFVLCMSPNTIGSKMLLIRAALLNAPVYVYPISRMPFEELPPANSFVSLVPMQVENLVNEQPTVLKQFRVILVGGAPLSQTLRSQLEVLRLPVFESFGMTETYSHIALRPVQSAYFEVLPGVSFTVQDGQLHLRAPHLGIQDLGTNDMIRAINTNSFEWLGRADFAINSGGYKFIPELLESKLNDKWKDPFFIAGTADSSLGQIVTLFLEGTYSKGEIAQLETILDLVFDRYERPKKCFMLVQFNRFENGKLNRLKTISSAHERAF